MAYEDYTIKQFINALFKDDRSIMNDEIFKVVYSEYIDTAGLYDTDEFSKVAYIHFLSNRNNTVAIAIRLQREFVNNFEIGYKPGFELFKKYGHTLVWSDKDQFIKRLESIEIKEKKYISKLEGEIKDLTELRQKKNKDKKPDIKQTESRGSFIRTLNSLGKIGYKIDNEKTTVEELAYMIKQQTEENKSL